MAKHMVIYTPANLSYSSEPHRVGYALRITETGNQYRHAELTFYLQTPGENRWRAVGSVVAQCNWVEEPATQVCHRLFNENFATDDLKRRIHQDRDHWGAFYGYHMGDPIVTDFRYDIDQEFASVRVVETIWHKIESMSDTRNLHHKYTDGLSNLVAALNLLGACPLERVGYDLQYTNSTAHLT